MSRKKNSNGQDTDAAENENVESAESEVEADAVEEVTEGTPNVEQTINEVAAEVDDTQEDEHEEQKQMEVDKKDAEIEQDQGFDQQSEPVTAANSGGKGMATTAMAVSLLALAGTGYNWYDTKSLKSAQVTASEQAAVDYSGQIASLEQQIQSLTESQEKLSAMSAAATTQTDTDESAAGVESDSADSTDSTDVAVEADSAVEEVAAVAQETEVPVEETASSDQVEESETAEESSESMVAETDEQAVEQESEQAVEETTQTEVVMSETTGESEAETAGEEAVAEASDGGSESMTTVSIPSSDEIKQIALQQVDEVLADAKKRLGLNEVAQLLSIGEQRLSLAGDVTGAQAAFSIADERLAAFSDPMIDPVRESVAENIESLAAVELVDKNALTQDLGNLASAVDTLAFKPLETLADEEQPADESAAEESVAETTESESETLSLEGAGNILKSWGSKLGDTIGEVGSGIAGDLKNMVRIKKTGPMSDVVLAPEQEYFIRENIKLMLGGAQRAVLQSNGGVYQQNIDQAQSLLSEFFDPDNADVQSVANQLTDLAQANLEPELPDISNSSASLSEVLKQLASADSSN